MVQFFSKILIQTLLNSTLPKYSVNLTHIRTIQILIGPNHNLE